MRSSASLLTVALAALPGCSRAPAPAEQAPREAVAAARRDAGSGPSARMEVPPHGVDAGTPRTVRAEIKPLTRFQIVPVGEAAVEPARATLEALRARYVAYGFDLGAVLPLPTVGPADCAGLLTSRVAARGTLLVVAGTVPCATPFGAVNAVLGTGLVPLGPLGPPGPAAERRLGALLASLVGELIGLSTPCTDGRACCALRKAPDLRTLDAQAAAPCPAHASELDRIREAAGMQ